MSTASVSASASPSSNLLPSSSFSPPSASSDSRLGPLRRLSQLRAYTQHHFSSPQHTAASSSSSSSSANSQRVSRRHTLGNRVSWFSAASTGPESSPSTVETSNRAPCPESEHQSTFARYSSVFFPSYRGLELDLRSQPSPSTESPSPPLRNETRRDIMARPRGSSQAVDARSNGEVSSAGNIHPSALESPDPVVSESPSTSSPRPKQKATIRFFPHQDSHASSRPSLPFIPISRTLPSDSCVIRVGRYSERDGLPVANPTEPSDAPVGFKSKVVSRKHCEFMYLNGQWHVKDVGSSSGTFLNHMRLSQPNIASRLYTIKDGDIVQLGIDFRGGEEMIFRCVRIRIECNRSWQQQPNEFNKNTENLIKNLGKGDTADYSGCRECSICLGSVLRPYQCLFMAACAHVWHYKCVSRLIHTPDYPMFQCPNCRAYTDLSAEVDDTNDLEEEEEESKSASAEDKPESARSETHTPQPEANPATPPSQTAGDERRLETRLPVEAGLAANIENMRLQDLDASDDNSAPLPAPTSNPDSAPSNSNHEIPGWQSLTQSPSSSHTRQAPLRAETPVRSESSDENPLTPLNDSGPLALDGRAAMP
ncbi:FHA domain protein [Aspergillus homomorphus CBS 101889]|uniref:FHA domain protein n=1 Tax=Aspergillus homomorphus (strain CBS 101889) TaxID=1450537 RepID=A0A395I393_ASPHC|nr:FHA domain protein [Aspergillus homomorphus CBS 101889]RAL14550.1 FHA domain protein [Aspergillus homomorphus CBS 101889]